MATKKKVEDKPAVVGRPFQKGKSGNPAGRARVTPEELDLIAACKERSPKALAVIDKIMTTSKSDRTALAAAIYVIDRAYGQARVVGEINQNVNVNHTGTIVHRAVQEIDARITELLGAGTNGADAPPVSH